MILIILTSFVAYLIYFYVHEFMNRHNRPPGPLPLPIIGNLLDLAMASNVPSWAVAKLGEKYGELYRVKIGSKEMFVPTSIEAIQKILGHDDIAGREQTGTLLDRNMGQNLGIAFSDGPSHQTMKTWTMKNLREFGFGKTSSMEIKINQELEILISDIDEAILNSKGIMKVNHMFIIPGFNVAWQMIVGHHSPEDDILIKRLLRKSAAMLASGIFGAGLINAFPFLRYIIPEFTGHNVQMTFYKDCWKTARELLNTSKKALKLKGDRKANNLIEAYALKMEDEQNNPATIYTEENFLAIFMDLLQASSDTSSTFLAAAMLYSVLYPDVQEKVYEEIQRCVPKDREVQVVDKNSMVYTQAFFLETHRHATIVQNFVPRVAFKDVWYKEYLIKKDVFAIEDLNIYNPGGVQNWEIRYANNVLNYLKHKGTVVMADLKTAYNSKSIWTDPEAFLPERFINGDGVLINQHQIFPFSLGKRLCPGESFAFTTYFLFFVTIMRKFKLSTVPRQKPPKKEMSVGMTSKPFPFEAVFSIRE